MSFLESSPESEDVEELSFLESALEAEDVEELREIYDEWADTYNQDVENEGYVAPELAAKMLVEHLSSRMEVSEAEIFDAGCGTGLVGQELRKLGVKTIDGCDISDRMRDIAEETGAYRSLSSIDLNGFATLPDLKYDAVICVGTMTQGHVAREAFLDLYRLTKHKGLILATIRDSVWERNGYEDYVRHMVRTQMVKVIRNPKTPQKIAAGVKARFVLLESMSDDIKCLRILKKNR